jgi:hypothetical protein
MNAVFNNKQDFTHKVKNNPPKYDFTFAFLSGFLYNYSSFIILELRVQSWQNNATSAAKAP